MVIECLAGGPQARPERARWSGRQITQRAWNTDRSRRGREREIEGKACKHQHLDSGRDIVWLDIGFFHLMGTWVNFKIRNLFPNKLNLRNRTKNNVYIKQELILSNIWPLNVIHSCLIWTLLFNIWFVKLFCSETGVLSLLCYVESAQFYLPTDLFYLLFYTLFSMFCSVNYTHLPCRVHAQLISSLKRSSIDIPIQPISNQRKPAPSQLITARGACACRAGGARPSQPRSSTKDVNAMAVKEGRKKGRRFIYLRFNNTRRQDTKGRRFSGKVNESTLYDFFHLIPTN